MRRVLPLLLLVSLVSILPAAPAMAATCRLSDPCSFDLATPKGGPSLTSNAGGHAEAAGTIEFTTSRNFSVSPSKVVDKCNAQGTGDGLHAYLYVTIYFKDGSIADWVPRFTSMKDEDGCSNGSYYTGPAVLVGAPDSGPRIKCVAAFLAESDVPGSAYDYAAGACKDNPYTP